jgi:hypothetical protein
MVEQDKNGRYIIPDAFERITLNSVMPADAILFYGGNFLTKLHGVRRRAEFDRVQLYEMTPTHAAMILHLSLTEVPPTAYILDPTIQTDLGNLKHYSSKLDTRIDIIRYDLTDTQRYTAANMGYALATAEGRYDVGGYGAFLSEMPCLSWVKKFIKPSEKYMFCSDGVSYCIQEKAGYKMSPYDHNFTAPVDMLLYALKTGCGRLFTLKKRGE